jgi:hypothetical protein
MKYSSAYPIIRTKIERNNNLIRLFKVKSSISKLEMIMHLRILKQNDVYISLIDEINAIEQKQLYEFTIERDVKIATLTNLINNTQINIKDLEKEMEKLTLKNKELIDLLKKMNSSIPETINVTNVNDEVSLMEFEKKCSFN